MMIVRGLLVRRRGKRKRGGDVYNNVTFLAWHGIGNEKANTGYFENYQGTVFLSIPTMILRSRSSGLTR
jgi:hypothetical protein